MCFNETPTVKQHCVNAKPQEASSDHLIPDSSTSPRDFAISGPPDMVRHVRSLGEENFLMAPKIACHNLHVLLPSLYKDSITGRKGKL